MKPRFHDPCRQPNHALRTTASRCEARVPATTAMVANQVVASAVFRRCTTPESPSKAERPAVVRCKPSCPMTLVPQAPSFDAVPRRTDDCQAMPAAAVRCKQPKTNAHTTTPGLQYDFGRRRRIQQPPLSLPLASSRPAKPPLIHRIAKMGLHQRRLQEGSDANSAAVARPTRGQGFHPEKQHRRDGLQDDAHNSGTTLSGTVVIAAGRLSP